MNTKAKFTRLSMMITLLCGCTSNYNNIDSVEQVLSQVHDCSPTLTIRSQSLEKIQVEQACNLLTRQETAFHQMFNTHEKPVANDNNVRMRANIYGDRASYVKYVTQHFNTPSDNGGMYIEGFPHQKINEAEFVAYARDGNILNMSHEYVHYLDGRFNIYGDFCASLHDLHNGPEFCPSPSPGFPHMVWWIEGLAEYLSKGKKNEAAVKAIAKRNYSLSELFNTSYVQNGGNERVYIWGYLAARFMIEHHKDQIDRMLELTRKGYFSRYQALARQWGNQYDEEFNNWINNLQSQQAEIAKAP